MQRNAIFCLHFGIWKSPELMQLINLNYDAVSAYINQRAFEISFLLQIEMQKHAGYCVILIY